MKELSCSCGAAILAVTVFMCLLMHSSVLASENESDTSSSSEEDSSSSEEDGEEDLKFNADIFYDTMVEAIEDYDTSEEMSLAKPPSTKATTVSPGKQQKSNSSAAGRNRSLKQASLQKVAKNHTLMPVITDAKVKLKNISSDVSSLRKSNSSALHIKDTGKNSSEKILQKKAVTNSTTHEEMKTVANNSSSLHIKDTGKNSSEKILQNKALINSSTHEEMKTVANNSSSLHIKDTGKNSSEKILQNKALINSSTHEEMTTVADDESVEYISSQEERIMKLPQIVYLQTEEEEFPEDVSLRIGRKNVSMEVDSSMDKKNSSVEISNRGYTIDDCTCVCGKSKSFENGEIVGGVVAKQLEFPWIAALLRHKKSFFCAGTLITRYHVMTAAHCLADINPQDITVILGDYDRESPLETNTEARSVSSGTQHEQFDVETFDHDIAILELETSVDFSPNIRAACLPNHKEARTYPGKKVVAAGWGRIKEGGDLSNVIRKVELPVLTPKQCEKMAGDDQITNNMICTGYPAGKKDACTGDSGGPLHLDDKVIGIVSWGNGCARPQTPGIFTNVANHIDWIKSKIGEQCLCPPLGRRNRG